MALRGVHVRPDLAWLAEALAKHYRDSTTWRFRVFVVGKYSLRRCLFVAGEL
jgi:hypothetical protein